MDKEQELRERIKKLQAGLEAIEEKQAGAVAEFDRAKAEWRQAVPAAELDGDTEAAERVAELQAFMADSQFAEQRSVLVAAELKRRIAETQAELERYVLREKPMRYFRRKPAGGEKFGPLTNWAMGLAGKVPAGGAAGAWQEVTEDRVRYELGRELPQGNSEAWRLLRTGEIVKTFSYDFRAEALESAP